MKKFFYGVGIALLCFPFVVFGRTDKVSIEDILSSFEFSADIASNVTIPTVVEVSVSDPSFRRGQYIVYESTTKSFQPSLYWEQRSVAPVSISCTADRVPSTGSVSALFDTTPATSVEFPVNTDISMDNTVHLTVALSREIVATGFVLNLEPFVALPRSVEISVPHADGSNRIVLAKSSVTNQTIRFPKTTASTFLIAFQYAQPLRINEISFFDEDDLRLDGRSVRFLARPGEKYALYFQSDRPVKGFSGESPNLSDDRDVKKLSALVIRMNPLFRPVDTDGDGVRDTFDNCVRDANMDQADENGNGLGDVCDDYDRDSIGNEKDNCPSHPNRDQVDTDHDGKGDVCDGEESRLTESHPWLPWVAMGFGSIVVISLFVLTIRSGRNNS